MRRAATLWLIFVAAIAGSAWAVRPSAARRQAPARGAAGRAVPAGVQGVATCASMACHHFNGPPGSKGSEYSTWAAQDPHARAYSALFEPRSQNIAKNLKRGAPQRDPLCLSCHVHPDPQARGLPERQRFAWSDGVGCEACHGEAKGWIRTHYLDAWRNKTSKQKEKAGMRNTKSLRVRAEVCARCHVGDGEMDVNHDLIAAGHPRLRFEFAAYHANYPKHWRENTLGTDFEARAWVIGQLASAQAALKLLDHRATAAAKNPDKKPWPEFAEYNCSACHHDLGPKSERQRLGFGPRRAGELPWGTWYFAMLPALKEAPGVPRSSLDLGLLDTLMRKRIPSEKEASAKAAAGARALSAWLDAVEKAPAWKAPQLARLLRGLAEDRTGLANAAPSKERPPATWDGATQLYLGLAAVYHGWGDRLAPRKPPVATKKAVEDLRQALEGAFPAGESNIYDSPSKFRPGALQAPLKKLRAPQ